MPPRSSESFRSRISAILRSPWFWACAVRVVYFAAISPIVFQGDAADYQHIAINLSSGHGFSRCPIPPFPPTAQRPPLFSFLLSGLYFMGAGAFWASFVLNFAFDLLSLQLVQQWVQENGFRGRGLKCAPWVIAFCPLLIAYAPYPTTENLSIFLFLAATTLLFRVGRESRTSGKSIFPALGSGICWGLLALCRSYFLLFPALLLLLPSSRRWKRPLLALMLGFSLIAPAVWVARNHAVFGKPSFSQGAAVGWQSYQGLCFTNFDWWSPQDVERVYDHPLLSRMISSYCTTDQEMGELDLLVRQEVLQDCVIGHPVDAAYNIAVKGVMLFINWGQLLPYTQIPDFVHWPINAFMGVYWVGVVISCGGGGVTENPVRNQASSMQPLFTTAFWVFSTF